MSEPAAAQPPQIVYVQVPTPAAAPLTPVQQAQLDNTAAWRNAGIISIILLLTFFFAWVIPLLLLAVLIGNGTRMNRARAEMAGDVAVPDPERQQRERNTLRWIGAVLLMVLGVVFTTAVATGSWGVVLLGVAMIGGGAALAPWNTLRSES